MAARGAVAAGAERPLAGERPFAASRAWTPAGLREAPLHWPRPSALDISIQALEGVGPKLAEAAAEAGIATVWDLLLRFPHRHRNRQLRPLGSLQTGETGTVLVEVLGAKPRPFRKRRLTIVGVKVGDESGSVRATWFNQPWVAEKLEPGAELLLTGKLTGKGFTVNEWELVSGGEEEEIEELLVRPGPRRDRGAAAAADPRMGRAGGGVGSQRG